MTLHEHDHITTSQHSARTFAPLSLFIAVERMHPNDFCCDVVFVDAAAAAVLLPFFASLFTLQIVITNYKPSFTTYFLTTRFFSFFSLFSMLLPAAADAMAVVVVVRLLSLERKSLDSLRSNIECN